jgi:preprotein translocase subunit SecB
MDKNKPPGISLNSILISELHFKRAPVISKKLEYDIEINTEASLNNEEHTLSEILKVTIRSKDAGLVEASCVVHGRFSTIKTEENFGLEEFSKENAPAILYPFCREAIASVSMKAGMPPILLPPFNFHAAQKKLEEGKENLSQKEGELPPKKGE